MGRGWSGERGAEFGLPDLHILELPLDGYKTGVG